MTITLASFVTKFNNLIGDNLTGTTDSDGNADKKDFIDSSLAEYPDNWFGDVERNAQWQAYISSELRTVKLSQSSGGVVAVYKEFTSQVKSGTAYELHRYDRNSKVDAINLALNDCYPWFYQRVEDESTLSGGGASDNDYEVPSAFAEFPDELYEKKVSTNKTTYVPILNFRPTEVGGTMYFYASVTSGNAILLVGKKHLSQFTNDASTTELSDGQAHVVCLLAASIFFRSLVAMVNSEDKERFENLANYYEDKYEQRKFRTCMPFLGRGKVNYEWLDE